MKRWVWLDLCEIVCPIMYKGAVWSVLRDYNQLQMFILVTRAAGWKEGGLVNASQPSGRNVSDNVSKRSRWYLDEGDGTLGRQTNPVGRLQVLGCYLKNQINMSWWDCLFFKAFCVLFTSSCRGKVISTFKSVLHRTCEVVIRTVTLQLHLKMSELQLCSLYRW